MSLANAIYWKWPTAKVITRGNVLEHWVGPPSRPTDQQLAQALADYLADRANIDAETSAAATLDQERLISAVVWEVIGAVNPPATKAKYNAARSNIIANYRTTPWK